MCLGWVNMALSTYEDLLQSFVYGGSRELRDHPGARSCGGDIAVLVERLLFVIGEVAVVGFNGKEDAAGPSDPSMPTDPGVVRPVISPTLVNLVQVLLPPQLPAKAASRNSASAPDDDSAEGQEEGGGAGQEQGRESSPQTPVGVRALAFITLGKLCLRDRGLAKGNISILVRELDTATDPAVRSNALVVLGDLCVRYTNMVDMHVGAMATCLQDSHIGVRRHAILLISQLVLQDYIKWRGLLLYRFLATLVDPEPSVAQLGRFTLTTPLISKKPGLFAQSFAEAVFVLNGYSDHPCYKAAAAAGAEGGGGVTMEGIDLEGDNKEQARRRTAVYNTMLEHMTDEQKISVTAKLAQEVLGAAVEGTLPLGSGVGGGGGAGGGGSGKGEGGRQRAKAQSVLRDALNVMSSPQIRVGRLGGGAEAGDEDMVGIGAEESGSAKLAAAKSKLLCKVSHKHLMESVIPILTALKQTLERAHSPLLKELMSYLGELFRCHKEDVKLVLSNEPGLAEEIEYDVRIFSEKESKRRKKKEAAAAAAAAEAAAAAAAATVAPMGAPRTPARGRRLSEGTPAPPVGRGGSKTPRAARTPMGAVRASVRKTPRQALEACSAVKLKRSPFVEDRQQREGGAGVREVVHTIGSKVSLRTPRQAMAAALGSPLSISPLPMRGDPALNMASQLPQAFVPATISAWGGGQGGGVAPVLNNIVKRQRPTGGANISGSGSSDGEGRSTDIMFSPPNPVPTSKKGRWSVSVDPGPGGMDVDPGSGAGDVKEEALGKAGVVANDAEALGERTETDENEVAEGGNIAGAGETGSDATKGGKVKTLKDSTKERGRGKG
ncbi:unnamed protein product, partial [Discosporangium mesarthrocarpum]